MIIFFIALGDYLDERKNISILPDLLPLRTSCVNITIESDFILETTEQFLIHLYTMDPGVTILRNSSFVLILDQSGT